MKEFEEAKISVNGIVLSESQATVIRIALVDFMIYMSSSEWSEGGEAEKSLAESYLRTAKAILPIIDKRYTRVTFDELKALFDDDDLSGSALGQDYDGDNAVDGLLIIRKYLPNAGIQGASADVIYSVDVDDIIDAGLELDDARQLSALNWMIVDGAYLGCFV